MLLTKVCKSIPLKQTTAWIICWAQGLLQQSVFYHVCCYPLALQPFQFHWTCTKPCFVSVMKSSTWGHPIKINTTHLAPVCQLQIRKSGNNVHCFWITLAKRHIMAAYLSEFQESLVVSGSDYWQLIHYTVDKTAFLYKHTHTQAHRDKCNMPEKPVSTHIVYCQMVYIAETYIN